MNKNKINNDLKLYATTSKGFSEILTNGQHIFISKTDIIKLFMNRKTLNSFLSRNKDIGVHKESGRIYIELKGFLLYLSEYTKRKTKAPKI